MEILQEIKLPKKLKPIVIIGAGSIVKDAHLPAYIKAGFKVSGIYDKTKEKAIELKKSFPKLEKIYDSLEELVKDGKKNDAIFDLAIPASHLCEILEKIPNGSPVLIQKPMGETMEQADKIIEISKRKNLVVAINFQLKYAPYMLAAKDMIDKGIIGEIYDLELMVCVYTPWHLWDFLFKTPRVEILYHSIHYLDLIRSFIGYPSNIYASTIKHPKMLDLASTRSTMILDYPNHTQARIITNHGHEFGKKHQQSYFKIEGTKGAIKIRIGVSLDYPDGEAPKFEYVILSDTSDEKVWKELPLKGGWFPDAFIGSMAELQNYCSDKTQPMSHDIENSYQTMKLVEAAYVSNNNKD